MTEILRITGPTATPLQATSMTQKGFLEVAHLEKWIVAHPEVIDPTLMILTTQFDQWTSDVGEARERPDILGLAANGQLVVIELKRASDRKVHLQALTYAALASGFTRTELARAHATWLTTQRGTRVTEQEADELIGSHVDEWRDELITVPRIIVVAEAFPPQVLTTVRWLDEVAADLLIECHEYRLFEEEDATYVAFNRLFPVEDLADRLLRPASREASENLRALQTETKRRARSVRVISERQGIPDGSHIDLRLTGLVNLGSVTLVENWLAQDPTRRNVRWVNDPVHPLRWAGSEDPDKKWTPSALRNEIFRRAGATEPSFSAADGWEYEGQSLYWWATDLLNDEAEADIAG